MNRKGDARKKLDVRKSSDAIPADRLRSLWLGCLAALLAATPIVPSESAELGSAVMALVLLWVLLLVGWMMSRVFAGQLEWRGGPAFWALVACLGWLTLSSLVMARHGQPRMTINSTCQWLSFGVAFLLIRQLVRSPAEMRSVVALMIAMAVTLSVTGYSQYFYENPIAREKFRKDPEKELRDAGIVAPAGTPQRKMFEDRLASVEPMATYALTNSLAGFIAPWFIVAVGLLMTNWSSAAARTRIAMIATMVLIVGCLVLTKSRTAYLATAVGLVLLGLFGRNTGWRPNGRLLAGLGLIGLLAPIVGIVIGGLDLKVVSEAPKSLLYRLQYWQATAGMIGDLPLFGCGIGNFQQYYTQYKLPEASESIAEPHNFAFEIWANAGTPAVIAFVAFLMAVAWQARAAAGDVQASPAETSGTPLDGESGSSAAILVGGFAGGLLGFACCVFLDGYVPTLSFLLAWFTIGLVCVWMWRPWVRNGRLPLAVPAIGAVVLLVNLMAAGGIGFSGVSITLWLLAPIVLGLAEANVAPVVVPRGVALGMLALAGCGLAAFSFIAYLPHVRSQTAYIQAESYLARGQFPAAVAAYEKSAAHDPFYAAPWERLADVAHHGWMAGGDPRARELFERAAKKLEQLQSHSATMHSNLGEWWLAAYRKEGRKAHIDEAIRHFQIATRLYPNYNLGHAKLAWALYVSGDENAAADEAATAIQLDNLNPHQEQKLANIRTLLEREASSATASSAVVAGQPPLIGSANPEQVMLRLRKTGS